MSASETLVRADVIAFMGVNGTGKSTLAERLVGRMPGTGVVHASNELRSYFGGISREKQNSMSIEDRLGEIATHLTSVFDSRLADHDTVLFDTQLLVPSAQGVERTYECAWSDTYTPYIGAAAMLVADCSTIRTWRETDALATGRQRDLSEENIARDQEANLAYFHGLVERGALPPDAIVLENADGQLDMIEAAIEELVLSR